MAAKDTEITTKKQSKGKVWLLLLLSSVFGSICLLWTFFGFYSYIYPSQATNPYTKTTFVEETSLIGKNGNYFIVLPVQQIQLVEKKDSIKTIEIQLAFSINFSSDKGEIDAKLPKIKDILISYFRSLSLDEIQESGRLFYIKESLLDRLNDLLFPTQIQDILFQKFIVKEGL